MDSEEIINDKTFIEELNDFKNDLDNMTINDLILNKIEPIKSIQNYFINWYNNFNNNSFINLKFNYSNNLNYNLPKDLLILEIREKNDLYDSYIGQYQYLLKYNKDIIDKNNFNLSNLTKELLWYKNACNLLLNTNLECLNTLTINYSWILTNNLNNEKINGNTKFLLFYYPIGIFNSNNLLPTTVWNRLIFRYKFFDNQICFIPSITKSWSNSDEFSLLINKEFNKLLFSIISFIERDNDIILDNNNNIINNFQINSFVKYNNLKIDMKFNIFNNKINIFDYKLLPFPTEYNNYYSNYLSPELININKFNDLINYLKIRYNKNTLIKNGFNENLFDLILESLYKPTKFNISILWWFINYDNNCKDLINNLLFSLKDNLIKLFNPENELEKLYYLTKIKIVSNNKLNSFDWLNKINDNDIKKYYSFNEMIHLINSLIMYKENHFYFKYQNYSDISNDFNKNIKKNKKGNNENNNNENEEEDDNIKIKNLDDLIIKFIYNNNLYQTNLKDLYNKNYLSLDNLFSLQRSINKKLFFDQNEYINYLYYLNGILKNRYQNKNTLLYTCKNLLNSYNNDMKSLYIIGESQCGKSVFKNILLQYINEYYEKTSTKQSDFNYDDSSILKVYDDIDLLDKKKHTNLILNKDSYTVNINEKNKQPIKVYKDITNIILNNDWPKIITWYHQRRIKTCLFIPNSKNSLDYIIQRIFKSNTRGNGSFNDVFINNFYQYLISYNDNLYYDGIYYSDCIHLLDSNLSIDILQENIKNILNLDSIIQTKGLIKTLSDKNIVTLKQLPFFNYLDYYVKNKFDILI